MYAGSKHPELATFHGSMLERPGWQRLPGVVALVIAFDEAAAAGSGVRSATRTRGPKGLSEWV